MANCPGRRGNSHCGALLHRCKKCGNVGCDLGQPAGKCTNQGFCGGKCLKCGSSGQQETFK